MPGSDPLASASYHHVPNGPQPPSRVSLVRDECQTDDSPGGPFQIQTITEQIHRLDNKMKIYLPTSI